MNYRSQPRIPVVQLLPWPHRAMPNSKESSTSALERMPDRLISVSHLGRDVQTIDEQTSAITAPFCTSKQYDSNLPPSWSPALLALKRARLACCSGRPKPRSTVGVPDMQPAPTGHPSQP